MLPDWNVTRVAYGFRLQGGNEVRHVLNYKQKRCHCRQSLA